MFHAWCGADGQKAIRAPRWTIERFGGWRREPFVVVPIGGCGGVGFGGVRRVRKEREERSEGGMKGEGVKGGRHLINRAATNRSPCERIHSPTPPLIPFHLFPPLVPRHLVLSLPPSLSFVRSYDLPPSLIFTYISPLLLLAIPVSTLYTYTLYLFPLNIIHFLNAPTNFLFFLFSSLTCNAHLLSSTEVFIRKIGPIWRLIYSKMTNKMILHTIY